MYDPIDRHGVYIPETDKAAKLINRYLMNLPNNISIIDGHICYKILRDIKSNDMVINEDKESGYLELCGDIEYRDVETDELMAVRHFEKEIGDK